ncbi:HNH endonuclease [Neoroseomonas rubea]|uniref:HNH endonuclease n=1 Tax=Neoroseomonas rubea TaxID=2748666 RepID=UPI0038CD7F04
MWAVSERARAIGAWRFRRIQRFGTQPGAEENPGANLFGGRTSISVRVRWEVLQRDGNRCVVCGQGASDGVTLEIDHIVPVSKGGSDEKSNLQILCAPCNRGESNRP